MGQLLDEKNRITSVERMEDSIIVAFGDGVTAVWSNAVLRSMLPHATSVVTAEPEEL